MVVKIEIELRRADLDMMLYCCANEDRVANHMISYDGKILKFFDEANDTWYHGDFNNQTVNKEAIKSIKVTDGRLIEALYILKEKTAFQFQNIINENDDAETHDCLAQAIAYKDVIFG
jgi:hypothetical protein